MKKRSVCKSTDRLVRNNVFIKNGLKEKDHKGTAMSKIPMIRFVRLRFH